MHTLCVVGDKSYFVNFNTTFLNTVPIILLLNNKLKYTTLIDRNTVSRYYNVTPSCAGEQ